jgi:hypothetical protein
MVGDFYKSATHSEAIQSRKPCVRKRLSGDIWGPTRRTQRIYGSAVFTASLMMHFVRGSTATVRQPS